METLREQSATAVSIAPSRKKRLLFDINYSKFSFFSQIYAAFMDKNTVFNAKICKFMAHLGQKSVKSVRLDIFFDFFQKTLAFLFRM
jgi:hypothetical protein